MFRTLCALLALATQTMAQPVPSTWHELPLQDGSTLSYKLGLPDGFDATETSPVLLALPPGPQTREMVEASWVRYWASQASERGWIVVSPAAPEGRTFYDGAEALLPELIRHVRATYSIEHDRLHLAGVSNGGRSAFRLATLSPQEFLSLTVLPGYPPTAEDEARLDVLSQLPVSMYAGGDDTHWVERMEDTATRLRALGADVTTTVFPGEGHTPPSMDGDVIMLRLQELRRLAAQASALASETRSANNGEPAVATDGTTVFVVRHADRRGHDDALTDAGHARAQALARMLEPTALDVIYATEYERTQQTVAPTASAQQLTPRVLSARSDLAAHLLREHPGQTILVAGHSNTVPAILAGLGLPRISDLSENQYGDLFIVTITYGEARLLHLKY